MAVAYHFFKDFDTTAPVYNRIRKTYDGPLSLAEESFEALTSLMRITPTCVGTIVEIRIWIVSETYSRIADINRLALFLGCIGLASILSQPVQAQALDIDQPEITKGEREVRSVNVVNGGFPVGSGGMPHTSHELSTSYSPIWSWTS